MGTKNPLDLVGMAYFELSCNYCGKEWKTVLYSKEEAESSKCPVCRDTSIKYKLIDKDNQKSDVFGYNENKKEEDAYIKRK